jgi:hypothetical protein
MNSFDLSAYLKKSTQSSGVPLKVTDETSLSIIAGLISQR